MIQHFFPTKQKAKHVFHISVGGGGFRIVLLIIKVKFIEFRGFVTVHRLRTEYDVVILLLQRHVFSRLQYSKYQQYDVKNVKVRTTL